MTLDQENIIRILQDVFTTKQDFYKFSEKFDLKFDEILNSNDKIARELKDLRQEVSFFHIGQKRQDQTLNNHENRLKTVESRI
ncbi:MAG: hypothetical protein AAB880_02465 [Patescibacteria group bacterium]